jgi:hypothetical protein
VDVVGIGDANGPVSGIFLGSEDIYIEAYGTVGDPALPALLDKFAAAQAACTNDAAAPLNSVVFDNGQPTAIVKLARVRDIVPGADIVMDVPAPTFSPSAGRRGRPDDEALVTRSTAAKAAPEFVVKNLGQTMDFVSSWLSDNADNRICSGPTLSIGADALQVGKVIGDLFPETCTTGRERTLRVHFTPVQKTGLFLAALLSGAAASSNNAY